MVEDPAGLDTALRGGKYDLVMTDVANANEVSQRVLSASLKPSLLPVVFRAAKKEQSTAQEKYQLSFDGHGNPESCLAAIDQAMDWKLKTINR